MIQLELNHRAQALVAAATADPQRFSVQISQDDSGATLINAGVGHAGSLSAGLLLAKACLAGLADVTVTPTASGELQSLGCATVCVQTGQPVAACMASQYAGWQIQGENFFGMGSGPMRSLAKKEPLFFELNVQEPADVAVGVLETDAVPPTAVCQMIADACGVSAENLALLFAPTNSIAGNLQVVARSLETCLHKLHELGFELDMVKSGFGTAPLPPVAKNSMAGIGRTNDAVLYGGEVTLWLDANDDQINDIGPKVPSSASADHGRPFAETFKSYDYDFYKVDPGLFSPAVVHLQSLQTGKQFTFGKFEPTVLAESFA